MPVRTIATLAIAVLLGLIVVFMINGFLNSSHNAQVAQAPSGPGSPVVVAALPIARGATITPDMLKLAKVPAGATPLGSFSAISALTGGKDAQRVAMRDLAPDEPILATRVSAPGAHLNLAGELTPGMQAVAVRMTDALGVGGFVVPGERVDVLMTRTSGGEASSSVAATQIIAENVRVLGIDQVDDDENTKATVVHTATIEVTPAQAQLVTLAQNVGTVSFSLRHVEDSQPQVQKATFLRALGAENVPKPRPVKVPHVAIVPVTTIRVTRVTDTTVYQLNGR